MKLGASSGDKEQSGRGAARRLRAKVTASIPGAAWAVLVGDALSAVGSGLTLPFLLVYLHTVCGIPEGYAGLAVAALAGAGLIGNPLSGWLADRAAPRTALLLGLLTAAGGAGALACVHSTWQAFAATGLMGLGAGIVWPAQDALLATVVESSQLSTVFAVRHATLNVGVGTGAALAGLIADLSSPVSFQLLYLLDAVTFLLFIPILLVAPGLRSRGALRPQTARCPGGGAEGLPGEGIRQVLSDRPFRRLWLVVLLAVTAGAVQIQAAFPIYAIESGGLDAGSLARMYTVNACAVVLMQLPVMRFMKQRLRTRGLAVVCLCWAATWVLTLAGGELGSGVGAVWMFTAAMAVFALGETFLSPTAAPLVNELASDHLRGRYNGLYVLAWTCGSIGGPALAGLLVSGQASLLFAICIAGLLTAAGLARRLERIVPEAVNRAAPTSIHATELVPAD
ncbi:MFS transporter [Streptomyces sp. NPDC060027]|uniref:MFS transporter n=1 Tax=Streptomyces sp. NPDC060027 TaxID=3347040 RepID=UPI0036970468